ncbi:hypothetical protein SLEP1_g51268 [Rubroshorea leprosula]|uniref:Uncharacterized protein n=1 Tax=Rubroshorea leprosula TaxID=152421 RepID=A0AAV5M566_9ROSI|nr:hypothetical protein SLEP1_g51268 [Rubroshorea leprosula]
MQGREGKTATLVDLLVCFPSRGHLTLMPKPICSPARPSEPTKRHHNHLQHHRRVLKKSSTRRGGSLASPLSWNKNKQMGSEIDEPTSPKVTCAGQIKVRPKTSSCKNWQSVMEEIERIQNSRKNKKRPSWVESLGFKKEIMQFLTCLRSIRLDFRCFGAFPQTDISTDDEDEEEDEDNEQNQRNLNAHVGKEGNEESRTIFSKWFMVLQENQNNGFCNEQRTEKENTQYSTDDQSVPPPNPLLLMRCRSAPAKGWVEEKEEEANENEAEEEGETEELGNKKGKDLRTLMDEEKRNKNKDQSLVVMKYDTDFNKISSDMAKETWLAGRTQDPLSRSRSWKR